MRSMTEDSVFVYDRTWDGLLTAVFDAFYRHQFPVAIIGEKDTPPLFAVVHRVITDEEKAGRVFRALQRKLSSAALACQSFFRTAGFGLTFVSVCMQSREGRAKH